MTPAGAGQALDWAQNIRPSEVLGISLLLCPSEWTHGGGQGLKGTGWRPRNM